MAKKRKPKPVGKSADTRPQNTDLKRPVFVVGAFLVLHIMLGFWYPLCMWGGDLLAFHPLWAQILFVVLSSMILIPAFRRRIVDGLSGLTRTLRVWDTPARSLAFGLILVLAGGGAFTVFGSAAHLLGDGYLRTRELDGALWDSNPSADRAPLAFWIIRALHQFGQTVWQSSEFTYRIYSTISGILYLLLVIPLTRVLGRKRQERGIVLGFLLTPGFLQLFFGYVETYSLLFPGMALFLLAGLQVLRGRLPLWVPGCVLGILIPLHFLMLSFIPSILVLAILRADTPSQGFSWKRPKKRDLVQLVVTPLVVLSVFQIIDFDPLAYLRNLKDSHLLSLVVDPDYSHHYGLISFGHLYDVLNEYLLVAPGAVIVLFLLPKGGFRLNSVSIFLLTASFFPILLTATANPEVGAFRDWDAFAFPALPLTLWAAASLIRQGRDPSSLAHTGFLVCSSAAFHSLLWIGLNADPAKAESRFAGLLEHCQLSGHARSYGWETLGKHYRYNSKTVKALQAYQQALEANPKNPRHWTMVGRMYSNLGQYRRGMAYFQRSISLDSTFVVAYSNLGTAYLNLGEHDAALKHLKKALALDPNLTGGHSNIGTVYFNLGEYETALKYFQKDIDLSPNFTHATFNVGASYFQLEQFEKAIGYFERTLELDPNLVGAYHYLGSIYGKKGKYQRSIEYFQRGIAIDPKHPDAHFNLGITYINLRQFENARDCLDKITELDPNDPRASELAKLIP